ncbi:undecaprenyldiphospho-muramoylpentapeptide beta-N-acetylglucosaminyltransferase [bacterium]|nr:undecaprenyldiphospho-muramoylpentapeptide beta-N-acetylglucosaminyltransferase [bacterium]
MTAAPGVYGICGGGTGGHIFPALAVVRELQKLAPDAKVYYFGKEKGMEEDLAQQRKLSFIGLKLSGLSRSLTWKNAVSLWQAGAGIGRARHTINQTGIQAILGTGGYVCGPVMLAAANLGIPSIIHESNFFPGLTNRWLGRWVTQVAVSHAPTGKHFSADKVVVTGFPLREGLDALDRESGCKVFGLDPARKILFVFPGSQAARRINRAIADLLPRLNQALPGLQMIWMTGEADYAMAKRVCEKSSVKVSLHAFVHEVPQAYAAADLVLARAGAGTIAELSTTGKPALLVPYPHAAANHQVHNAEVLQKYGSAEMMEDDGLNDETLLARLMKVFKRLRYMNDCGAVLRAGYPKYAARDLAGMLIALAAKKTKERSRLG